MRCQIRSYLGQWCAIRAYKKTIIQGNLTTGTELRLISSRQLLTIENKVKIISMFGCIVVKNIQMNLSFFGKREEETLPSPPPH